jgi:hypothetical protein
VRQLNEMNPTFDARTLANDLHDVNRIYAHLFAILDTTRWDTPARRGRNEWTLHETIAHLCAPDSSSSVSAADASWSSRSGLPVVSTDQRGLVQRLSTLECTTPWTPRTH